MRASTQSVDCVTNLQSKPADILLRLNYRINHPFNRPSDAYHTLYSLSGLATAQHRVSPSESMREELLQGWKEVEGDPQLDAMHKLAFAHARAWLEEPGGSVYAGTAADRIVSIPNRLYDSIQSIDMPQERDASYLQHDNHSFTRHFGPFLSATMNKRVCNEKMLSQTCTTNAMELITWN